MIIEFWLVLRGASLGQPKFNCVLSVFTEVANSLLQLKMGVQEVKGKSHAATNIRYITLLKL